MQKTIELVELDDIIPSPTNPRKYFNEARLKELAESIKKVGIIQAITLRKVEGTKNPPSGGRGAGLYEIVCGERRYRASKLAGLKTIPADIRDLTDEAVQELQFIENIEREDVHPMDEAVTFKAMQESKTRIWLLEDIAGKINKPVTYVVHRLQLNQLIPALQKEFWDEKFLIGHAILFARLTEDDQKECLKNTKHGGYYGTVHETQDYIERNIMRQLSAAPFKLDDGTLEVKCGAGNCINCFKRSGGNTLLFSDIKKDDRCFDKVCFQQKKEAWLIREVKEILETGSEILLVDYGYNGAKVPAEITKLSKQYKIRILSYQQNEVQTHQQNGYAPFKALFVSGSDMAKYKTVYKKVAGKAAVAAKAAAGEKITASDIDEMIANINQRVKRGDELDFEKVQEAIVKDLRDNYPESEPLKIPFANEPLVKLFIAYIIFNELGRYRYPLLLEALKIEEQIKEFGLFHVLLNLSDIQYHSIIKAVLMDKFSQSVTDGPHPHIIRKLADALDIEVDKHIALQEVAKQKRITNAAKKIAELTEQKAALKPKKAPAAKQKQIAPRAKKVA